jgi:hypothetical protein
MIVLPLVFLRPDDQCRSLWQRHDAIRPARVSQNAADSGAASASSLKFIPSISKTECRPPIVSKRWGVLAKAMVLAGGILLIAPVSRIGLLPGLLTMAIAADAGRSEPSKVTDEPRADASRMRLREGSRIGPTIGRFSRAGRRWIFEVEPPTVDDDQAKPAIDGSVDSDAALSGKPVMPAQFHILENLALQRVADAAAQDTNDLRWTVTGVLTEFSGENWLLLSTVYRAPIKSDTATKKSDTATKK